MTTRRVGIISAVAALALLLVIGYTLSRDSDSNSPGATVWNESEIVDHMGLQNDSGAWVYTTRNGTRCSIAIVLTSAGQVDLYQRAGDTVATNPEGTAGVKIVGGEKRTCLDAATEALSDLQ